MSKNPCFLGVFGQIVAEAVGFEPTCRLPDKCFSRAPRYGHFGTLPTANVNFRRVKRRCQIPRFVPVIPDLCPDLYLYLQFIVLQCACRFIQARVFGSYAVYVWSCFRQICSLRPSSEAAFGKFAVYVPPKSVVGVGASTVVVNLPKEELIVLSNNGFPVFSPLFLAILQIFQPRKFVGYGLRLQSCKVAEKHSGQRAAPISSAS